MHVTEEEMKGRKSLWSRLDVIRKTVVNPWLSEEDQLRLDNYATKTRRDFQAKHIRQAHLEEIKQRDGEEAAEKERVKLEERDAKLAEDNKGRIQKARKAAFDAKTSEILEVKNTYWERINQAKQLGVKQTDETRQAEEDVKKKFVQRLANEPEQAAQAAEDEILDKLQEESTGFVIAEKVPSGLEPKDAALRLQEQNRIKDKSQREQMKLAAKAARKVKEKQEIAEIDDFWARRKKEQDVNEREKTDVYAHQTHGPHRKHSKPKPVPEPVATGRPIVQHPENKPEATKPVSAYAPGLGEVPRRK